MTDTLYALPGAQRQKPADQIAIDTAQRVLGVALPESYSRLLLATDGLTLLDVIYVS